MDAAESERVKAKKGSFKVPARAIDMLISHRATAWQIAVYLTIAKHTDESAKFSTAGYKVIGKATGALPGTKAAPGTGVRIVQELLAMGAEGGKKHDPQRLLYLPAEWTAKTGETVPETPNKLYPVSFVVNDFQTEEWVWVPNELVEGHGKFSQPLKRLKQCGDVAARILIHAYRVHNMEEFGGIPPYKNFYTLYETQKLTTYVGFTFYTTHSSNGWTDTPLAFRILGEMDQKKQGQLDPYWNALKALEANGFVYEVVTVMDGKPGTNDARPMYELWVKGRVGKATKGEEGVAHKIDSFLTARNWDRAADPLGRYYNKFHFVVREGMTPSAVGIYRLRFRVANPKNYTVTSSWQRILADRDAVIGDLELLESLWPTKPAV